MPENKNTQKPDCELAHSASLPSCDEFKIRQEFLEKVIDGQATPEEEKEYQEVMEHCGNCQCRAYCDEILAIKNLLKNKLGKKEVPTDLIDNIKAKISHSA